MSMLSSRHLLRRRLGFLFEVSLLLLLRVFGRRRLYRRLVGVTIS